MARWENDRHNLRTSILDRLVDETPGVSGESVQDRVLSVAQIRASVMQDLEQLLNSRRRILQPATGYPEVINSLYAYGVADFTASNPKSIAVQQQLRRDIEKTIARFEPRLKNVRVHLETAGQSHRQLRFRITAMLVVEPISEPISFDTFFDMNRSECIISK
ncbi:MAG: type VI secretion system baseplate subunit TssE [Desulfobacterales bacterium]|nr:type VI secretion system baseplate subunit TssE [Desulfobacterales bacterium]